jgi:hypothetical protein
VKAAQLIRIARLRRFVGVFARGGDRDATAEALTQLAHASRSGGFTADALRRARQAAQLLAEEETGEPGARALLHLGSLCLETGAPEAAIVAAELARDRAAALPEPVRAELVAGATLLAGIAHGVTGSEAEARAELSEARDRLVACNRPAGAALALVQQGLLDIDAEHVERAELCFAYARDFYRAARLPLAAVEAAAVAARAFSDRARASHAERWFGVAIADADAAGAAQLAAELVIDHAAEIERTGRTAEAAAIASDAVRRCALVGDDAELSSRLHVLLARLAEDPRAALRHVEAAFEAALARRDVPMLEDVLDVLVSGLAKQRFAEDAWQLVAQLRDRLAEAELDPLAELADRALAELRA